MRINFMRGIMYAAPYGVLITTHKNDTSSVSFADSFSSRRSLIQNMFASLPCKLLIPA